MLPFKHDEENLLEAISLTGVMEKAKEGKTIGDLTIDELYRLLAYQYLVVSKEEMSFAPLIYKDDVASKIVEDIEIKLRKFVKDMEQDERKILELLSEELDKFIKESEEQEKLDA